MNDTVGIRYRPIGIAEGSDPAPRQTALSELLAEQHAECDLVYDYLEPFDTEIDDMSAERESGDCVLDASGQSDDIYQSGDIYLSSGLRLYIASDLRIDAFHQPLRLGAWRVVVP